MIVRLVIAPLLLGAARYERFDGTVFAASTGAAVCTGCHSTDYRGLTSRDFVLTPFPLR